MSLTSYQAAPPRVFLGNALCIEVHISATCFLQKLSSDYCETRVLGIMSLTLVSPNVKESYEEEKEGGA
jgi:hypothetical protein